MLTSYLQTANDTIIWLLRSHSEVSSKLLMR